ncbi:ComEC/Rec2 family competence protein [Elusimicrobiota bacterium]
MSSFKTPLFLALICAIIFALTLERLKPPGKTPHLPESIDPGYHLIHATLTKRIGKYWSAQTQSIDLAAFKISLLIKDAQKDSSSAKSRFDNLAKGDAVAFWARLRSPKKASMPQAFDWAIFLSEKGITGEAIIDRGRDISVIKRGKGLGGFFDSLRNRLLALVRADFKNDPNAIAVLSALTLGEKKYLDAQAKESFAKTGLMHLLVVSGLHVALIAGFLLIVLNYLPFGKSANLSLWFVGIWGFALLTGANPPALRATIMLSIFRALPLLKRETSSLSRLFLVALLFLLVSPSLISEASFLLSFAATFGIIFGWEGYQETGRAQATLWTYFKRIFLSSLFAWYSLLPFLSFFFHRIALLSPIMNLVAVPLATILLVMGLCHICFLTYIPIACMASKIIVSGLSYILIKTVGLLSLVPYSSLDMASWNPVLIIAWGLMFPAYALRRNKHAFIALIICASLLCAAGICKKSSASAKLHFLSNGNDCVALYFEKGFNSILFAMDPSNQYLNRRINGFLKQKGKLGARKIDLLRPARASLKTLPPNIKLLERFGAFTRDSKISPVMILCENGPVIFPLTPYSVDIIKEEVPSTEISCEDEK